MTTISKNNYELYFVDYYDGNLSQAQIDELLHFLKENPDLEEEFYSFENIHTFTNNDEVFANKVSLIRSINDIKEITNKNFDEFCVAYIENDLNEQNRLKFEQFLIENKHLEAEFKKYKLTKLEAEIVSYQHKNKLKKYTGRVLQLRRTISIAAAASVVGIALLLINVKDNTAPVPLAQTNNTLQEEHVVIAKVTEPVVADKIVENKKETKINPERKSTEEKKDSEKEAATTEEEKEDKKEKEQLKPVMRKGVFLVNSEWNKTINPAIPSTPQQVVEDNNELEMLIAESNIENNSNDELSIEKVRQLLNGDSKLKNISLWEIADRGLRGFGKMTESEYSVKPVISDDGDLEKIAFSTEKFTLYAPVKRNSK